MRLNTILRNCLVLLSLAALALWQTGCGETTPPSKPGTTGGTPKVSTGAPADESKPTDLKPADSKPAAGADDENMEEGEKAGAEKSEPGEGDEQNTSTETP